MWKRVVRKVGADTSWDRSHGFEPPQDSPVMVVHRHAGGYPVTPDGRYLVVRGRLWSMSDPALVEDRRTKLVGHLMEARRAVAAAKRHQDSEAERLARAVVDRVKRCLGDRGPVWWNDASPDLNRHIALNTIYADWFTQLG